MSVATSRSGETSGSSGIASLHKPRLDVIVFDGKDFGLWKMRMEGLFMAHGILAVVENQHCRARDRGSHERSTGTVRGRSSSSSVGVADSSASVWRSLEASSRGRQADAGHELDGSATRAASVCACGDVWLISSHTFSAKAIRSRT